MSTSPTSPRPSVIQLAIKEKGALYAAYIPCSRKAASSFRPRRDYKLGDDIYVLLSLPE
jgi:type IV pilus assembly protein PilZ